MATFVNDLRLTELATGEGSGSWGTTTNVSLELIGEALGYATQQVFGSDADATTTIADGASDPARAMYFKITSAGSLTATRTCTIAPNTVSRVMFIENATTGSQSIAISQGSGANVTILTGKTAVVYLDGAGSGAAVVDAMAGVDPGVTDTLTEVLVAGNTSGGTNIELSTTDKVQFRDTAIYINSSADGQLDIVADTEIQIAATTVDLNGNLDVSGTALVTGVLTTTAATVHTNGITMPDNAKAIFGASSDLEIYHDGSHSRIADRGTGDLRLYGDSLQLNSWTSAENYLTATTDGAVTIYHNGSEKLATTATGIDVTGSVTADGLTVNGEGSIIALSDNAVFNVNVSGGTSKTSTINQRAKSSNGSNADTSIVVTGSGGEAVSAWDFKLDTANGALTKAMTIDGDGNLSLYEDTGTTPKFVWDASAESLGIGTSTPLDKLTVDGGNIRLESSTNQWLYASDTGAVKSGFNFDVTNKNLIAYTNAAERLRIDSSGNVGIGTSSPSAKAAINTSGSGVQSCLIINNEHGYGAGVGTAGTALQFARDNSPSDGQTIIGAEIASSNESETTSAGHNLTFSTNNSSGSLTEAMRIDSSGNVGIGTSSPSDYYSNNLVVSVGAEGGITIASTATTNENYINFADGTTGTERYRGMISYDHSDDSMAFRTLSLERLRIDSSGKLGIGTSSPVNKLHLLNAGTTAISNGIANSGAIIDGGSGNAALNLITGNAGTCYVNFGDSTDSNIGRIFYQHSDNSMVFSSNVTERMRIDASGNVGIGSNNPSFATGSGLEIQRTSATATMRLEYTGSNAFELSAEVGQNTYNAVSSLPHVFEIGSVEKMRLDASGNLLVGTTSSFGGLINVPVTTSDEAMVTESNSTSASTHLNFRNSNGFVGSISTSGSATAYNTSSDQRLKENIADADDAGSKIDAIQVRKFDWKVDGSHQDYGMVAQELLEVAPEAVSAPEDPEDMMGVDYSKLVPMMLKEIQSLRARIAALES